MVEYLHNYDFLIVSLWCVFFFVLIIPFLKRYWYSIFLIEQYLTSVYSSVGECELFDDSVDNIISPWKIAMKYKYDDIHLGLCVYDVDFFNSTIEIIRKRNNKDGENES